MNKSSSSSSASSSPTHLSPQSSIMDMDMNTSFSNLHVAILSSPGMGHLIPAVVLGNRLASHHHVRVTILLVTVARSPPDSKLLKLPLHQLVQIQNLPPVDISHLVDFSTKIVTQLCLLARSAAPSVRSALAAMYPRPDALFVDIFGTHMLPIAAEFGMSKYVYIPSTAWFTALTVCCPVLHHVIKGEYVQQKGPIKIPGCKPVRPDDLVDSMLDRSDQEYDEYVMMGKLIPLFDGILINSWKDLEPETLHALAKNDEILKAFSRIPVYPVGPLTRQPETEESSSKLTAWLDRQPNESVIFVSFGSGGVLSQEQMTELALGLELSRQRFVWVVRPPMAGRVDGGYLSASTNSDGGPNYLPDGFMSRVHNVGFLVPTWAQQAQILAHPAVGGFLSHSGWNSTLESIINEVPIIAWPLYAEQKMNAAFLVDDAGVALRPRPSQVVGREEIEKMVRMLMEEKEGQCLRKKVKQLKKSATEALNLGGSSHKSMCQLLAKIAST